MRRLLVLCFWCFFLGCQTTGPLNSNIKQTDAGNFSRLRIPEQGVLVGASLSGGDEAAFNEKTGINHAVFVEFFKYPEILTDVGLRDYISAFVRRVIALRALPVLTLEPFGGLDSYTSDQVLGMAEYLNSFQYPIVLRWAHEMNGGWYAWGQQPQKYKTKFREFAEILKQRAPLVSMAWAPNLALGFPWEAKSIENFDSSDAYWQFYPGDDVVDIIGISTYHWGWSSSDGKLGHNIIPSPVSWEAGGDIKTGLKNFHDSVALARGKPLFVFETAAIYNLDEQGGDSDRSIKQAWVEQVYDVKILKSSLSQIRAIMWFNVNKVEEFEGRLSRVSWTLDSVIDIYRNLLRDPYFFKSEELQSLIRKN